MDPFPQSPVQGSGRAPCPTGRHVKAWRKNKVARIWIGEPTGEVRTYSYFALHREVCPFASILRAKAVNKDDRVMIC